MSELNDFPFEAFNETGAQTTDASTDTSFLNEFNQSEESVPHETEQVEVTQPTTETTQTPTTPEQELVNEVVNKSDYEKVIAEKAELESKLSSMSQSDLDENSKVIYDYIREGKLKELNDFLSVQTQDYSSKSQDQLVAEYLKAQNPEWTTEDIEDEMSSTYGLGLDEDLLTDQEKRAYSRKLKADAKEALQFFESKKSEIKLPNLNPVSNEPVLELKNQEELQAQAEEAYKLWESSVSESMKDFNKISIALKENEQFDFAVGEDVANPLIEDMKMLGKDISVFFKPYISEDGKVNARKLAEDMAFLRNKEAIVRSAVTQQVAKAQDDWLKGIKNTQMSPNPSAPVIQKNDDIADFIANKLF
jgi:hypothetical protein